MYWVAGAAVVGAVVGAVATNAASDEASDAATYAADQQMTTAEMNIQLAREQMASAEAASARAAEMMAGATTEAARIQAEAAKHAADNSYRAAAEALAFQQEQWNKAQKNMAPYLEAGGKGLNQLAYGLGLPGYSGVGESGYLTKPFTNFGELPKINSDPFPEYKFNFNFEEEPGYNFRLSEGMKALDRSASSKGNLLSGATLRGVTKFGQDFASNEYQNAYNRAFNANLTDYNSDVNAYNINYSRDVDAYNRAYGKNTDDYNRYTANQNMRYNQLSNLATMGQNTSVQAGTMGMQMANNAGNILTNTTGQANQYGMTAAQAQAQGLTQSAQYAGQQAQWANNLGAQYTGQIMSNNIAGANALGNAAMAKANANASSYMGYGNIASSLANALGNYYGNSYSPASTSNPYYYNPNAFSGYNSNQWAGSSNYNY